MNATIQAVVEDFAKNRSHGGYDINQAFTRDLNYGSIPCAIRSTNHGPIPRPTMCVAATAEVIIETLNLYQKSHTASPLFDELPLSTWTSGKITSARANIFTYTGTGSRGTGYALELLGIGKEKTFDKLNPYDFVNLNRRGGSGHSVTFIAYLGKDAKELDRYIADEVVGFKYFSELWDPSEWKIDEAHNRLVSNLRRSIENQYDRGAPRGLVDSVLQSTLDVELQPAFDRFTEETTD
jgi:hypothetical protein